MKIAVRMGHMKNVDQGASGIVSEYDVNRAYTPCLIHALKRCNFEVVDVTPTSAISTNDSLCQGVDGANNSGADLFISCHVNAFSNSQANGSTLVYGSEWEKKLAQFILDELVGVGFTGRDLLPNDRGLYEIKATKMSTVIVEPFFCTNQSDVDKYNKIGANGLGEAIAKGICKYTGVEYVEEPETVINEIEETISEKLNKEIIDLKAQIAQKDARIIELTNMYYSLLGDVKNIGNKYA